MTGSVVGTPPHPIGGLVGVNSGFFLPVGMLVGMMGPLATMVVTVILAVKEDVRVRIDRKKRVDTTSLNKVTELTYPLSPFHPLPP
jgi:hypothetical protein